MGCMVKIKVHEDDMDAILALISIGLVKKEREQTVYKTEIMEIYKGAVQRFKNGTRLYDCLDGKDRTYQRDTRLTWPKINLK